MFKDGDEIVPGLQMVSTPGHTQGHVSLALKGGDGLVITGDALTHQTISFAHPEWKPATKHVPDQAVATRKKLLDRLATDKMKLIGFHLPYPGRGPGRAQGRSLSLRRRLTGIVRLSVRLVLITPDYRRTAKGLSLRCNATEIAHDHHRQGRHL
ncbi:MAG: hypothetical protein WC670_03305 [Pseudolabrys sp.]|jgi:glyoxylase-like metal-dependent hydrolase (beta-lactamase superfamily II)